MALINVISPYKLQCRTRIYRCSVGENGFTDDHREGDKKTPVGIFPLRECWYRADRIMRPRTGLPLKTIAPDDGWCDAVESPCYNRPIKLPFAGSHEQLWREDTIYDIMVPIGFNDEETIPGKGSAIFFHLATEHYQPTLGCVAVALTDMQEILASLDTDSRIAICQS